MRPFLPRIGIQTVDFAPRHSRICPVLRATPCGRKSASALPATSAPTRYTLVCCARAASGQATAPPSAAINSRRPMLTGMCPSLCEGCLVRGMIPRREQAVFTFGRAGMPVRRRNCNDRYPRRRLWRSRCGLRIAIRTLPGHLARPAQLSPFPAAALSGGDGMAVAGRNCHATARNVDCHHRHSGEKQEG